jgi:ferritin
MAHSNIPTPVLTELNRQLNHELGAAHAYHAMSCWCATQNLKGCGGFFAQQAAEEREHAGKIVKHLIDRGAMPAIGALPAPKLEFRNLLEVAQQALAMEQANTRGIHAVFAAAIAEKDYPAQVLMHWFIGEQVEEEAWAAELVDRVQAASCAGSLMDLDRHVVKLLEGDKQD